MRIIRSVEIEDHFCVLSGQDCTKADVCASNPCANGGRCISTESVFICTCTPFFTGITCKQDVNECDTSPSLCRNGGLCINEVGGYRCQCPPEYVGKYCESRYLPCNPSPCLNGGTCIQKGETSYECSCVPGNITDETCSSSFVLLRNYKAGQSVVDNMRRVAVMRNNAEIQLLKKTMNVQWCGYPLLNFIELLLGVK